METSQQDQEKSNQNITDLSNNQNKENESQDDGSFNQISNSIKQDTNEIDFENKENDDEFWRKIEQRVSKQENSNKTDLDIINAHLQDQALLKTLNVIGFKGNFHFNNFLDAIYNNSIPKFVLYLFNITTIEGIILNNNEDQSNNEEKITKSEINNINLVINFLKGKEIKFQILKFDFENEETQEASSILFYSNLLNYFYIKNLKKDFYIRCSILLCTKKEFTHLDNYEELTNFKTYNGLLHLISENNLHFNYDELPDDDENSEKYFQKARIPMIITKNILDIGMNKFLPDSIFYQIQLIFDEIDSKPKKFKMIELFLKALHIIKQIKVPKYDILASSIKIKRKSIDLQKIRSDQYLNKKSSQLNQSSENSIETIELNNKAKPVQNKNKSKNKNKIKTAEQFYNVPDSNFKFVNGISYMGAMNENLHRLKFWEEKMNFVTKGKELKREKEKKTKKILFSSLDKTEKSKLYKIFYYDETENEWKFNSEVFSEFSRAKKINKEEIKTPIILIMNSDEDDSRTMISNFINCEIPKEFIEMNEEEIFIYGFCDRPLSQLNYYIEPENENKNQIKPIFLLLHVPTQKQKLSNFQSIIYGIYIYLSIICDIKITLLTKKYFKDQIDFSKMIRSIYTPPKNTKKPVQKEPKPKPKSQKKLELNPPEIIKRKSKTILCFSDETVNYNQILENKFINLFDFEYGILDYEKHFINPKQIESYKYLLESINTILLKGCSIYSNIEKNFQLIKLANLCNFYCQIRMETYSYKELLKDKLLKRFDLLYENSNDLIGSLEQIKQEILYITPPFDKKFFDSCLVSLNLIENKIKKINFVNGPIKNKELFYNQRDLQFCFDNGVFYFKSSSKKIKDRTDHWERVIKNTLKDKRLKNEKENSMKKILFSSLDKTEKSKLYKIFYYDETENEWKFNSEVFSEFSRAKKINKEEIKTPIILIMNSDEDESRTMISNFINCEIPKEFIEMNEEEIFIYGFCDRPLSQLNYYIEPENENKNQIKPIFLLLHVPTQKQKLSNFQSIIYGIYIYLSIICDIKITLLTKKYFKDQIDFLDMIKSIQNKRKKTSKSFIKDDDNDDDDDDEKLYSPNIFEHKSNTIVCFVDETVQYNKNFEKVYFQNYNYLPKFSYKKHFLFLKQTESYKNFLTSLNDQIVIENCSIFSEVEKNFENISVANMTNFYCSLLDMSSESSEKALKNKLTSRFENFENNFNHDLNQSLQQLKNEIKYITPLFDIPFYYDCLSICGLFEKKINQQDSKSFAIQLEESANKDIEKLTESLKDYIYLSMAEMNMIKHRHLNFLKDEYFNIIMSSCQSENIPNVYDDNLGVVNDQYNKSCKVLNSAFKPFIDKLKLKNKPKEAEIKNEIRSGTNYSMRETENIREIKVQVQINKDLKSEIEQDF